jgi:hypothetical protein
MGCYYSREQISLTLYSRHYATQRYIKEVLGHIVVPYVSSKEEGIFQNNARSHIAQASLAFWKRKKSNCCHGPLDPPIYGPLTNIYPLSFLINESHYRYYED